jgi:hypothetical protein
MKETFHVINGMVEDGVIESYAVGGAIGAMFYVEAFATEDIDVFVVMPPTANSLLVSLDAYATYLAKRGYEPQGEGFLIAGWLVQFIPIHDDLTEEASREALYQSFDDIFVRVILAEHLVAIMLQTGRPKDYARAHMFLEQDALDKDVLADILRRHRLEDKWQELLRLRLI